MKAIRTYKLKITSEHQKFSQISTSYKQAANWLSNIVHQRGKPFTPNKLSKEFYNTVREKFNLPSQVTCSLFRHVVSTYRSMKSNKEWQLAVYKRTNVPICWRRDFNISSKGLTVWGEPIQYKSRDLPKDGKWSDSKLKCFNGQWYLCLTIEIDIPEPKTTGTVVGVDSGIKNLLTAVDKKTNKTKYISGNNLNHTRSCIRRVRAKVTSVGTRSAKRLLKRLSGKEKSVTQELCHVASKQLVSFAQSVGAKTIVMEDLTGIRKSKKEQHRKQRARNNRWPFRQCQFYVSYKAAEKGIEVVFVNPAHTSQSCPICGHCKKTNRTGLIFRCESCSYQDNADRVGANNIALRLLLQRQASEERAMYQLAYSDESSDSVANLGTCPEVVDRVPLLLHTCGKCLG